VSVTQRALRDELAHRETVASHALSELYVVELNS
jgi:hypothetical protein